MNGKQCPSGSLDDGNSNPHIAALMNNVREWLIDQYAKRGDLLETKAIAEINDRPFYLQAELEKVDWLVRSGEQLIAEVTK